MFYSFKIPSKILNEVLSELEGITMPFAKDTQLVSLSIYKHIGKRVSEIHLDINHVPLAINLRMSWEQYNAVVAELKRLVGEIANKAINVMEKHEARMKDYHNKTWVQLSREWHDIKGDVSL